MVSCEFFVITSTFTVRALGNAYRGTILFVTCLARFARKAMVPFVLLWENSKRLIEEKNQRASWVINGALGASEEDQDQRIIVRGVRGGIGRAPQRAGSPDWIGASPGPS